jgi:hypothetical protein
MKPPVAPRARVALHEGLSSPGSVVELAAITACYPRVCSLAKRQVTYSGRGKKKRSHLSAERSFRNAHGNPQTRDIRDEIDAVKFRLLLPCRSGGLVSWDEVQDASGR